MYFYDMFKMLESMVSCKWRSAAVFFVFCALCGCSQTVSGPKQDIDEYASEESDHHAVKSSSSSAVSSTKTTLEKIYDAVSEEGRYTRRDSVAAYLCKFDKLPGNYVGQNTGKALYESYTGEKFSKWNFNPWTTIGVMIGGDVFTNKEGLLPYGSYREADVDYSGKNRGTKRLVYQSGCTIYYTGNHYESFSEIAFPGH